MAGSNLTFRLEENYQAAERMMSGPWWESEYEDLFAPEFEVDFPFAPPGMDQHLGAGHLLAHKEWMCRTVKNWYVRDMKIYGPKDPFGDKYIIVRYAGGGHNRMCKSFRYAFELKGRMPCIIFL